MSDREMYVIGEIFMEEGIAFLDRAILSEDEARKKFKKICKEKKIKFAEESFQANYSSSYINILGGLLQYTDITIDKQRREEVVNKLFEIVSNLKDKVCGGK